MLEHLLQTAGFHAHLAPQRIKPHGGKVIKVLVNHGDGEVHILAVRLATQLQQNTLAQVTGGDTCRIQRLHDFYHLLDLLGIDHIAIVEGHVIGNLRSATAQIAAILQVAHDGVGNDLLGLVEFQLAQLVGEVFLQGLLAHSSGGIILVVTAMVVGNEAIPSHGIIVTAVLVDAVVVSAPFVGGTAVVLGVLLIVFIVRHLFKRLILTDLVVDKLGHLGIAFFQHQAQQALLFQCQALRLLLFLCESLYCHDCKRFCV